MEKSGEHTFVDQFIKRLSKEKGPPGKGMKHRNAWPEYSLEGQVKNLRL